MRAYEKLINLMDSLKNTYEFKQLPDLLSKKGQKKCSICGRRNIVILDEKERRNAKLIENENLCEVCIIKRNYCKANYPSIYEIALKEWTKIYKDQQKHKKVDINLSTIFKNEYKYYNTNEINRIIRELKSINSFINVKFKKNLQEYNRSVSYTHLQILCIHRYL